MTDTNLTEIPTSKKEKTKKTARWWSKQVKIAEKEAERFRRQARDAYNEYEFGAARDRNYSYDTASNQHYSMYWASLQTTLPSIYSQLPVPIVKRKFDDSDDIGRVGSMILERFAKSLVRETPFHSVMQGIAKDYKITGLGAGRVRVVEKKERTTRIYYSPEELEQGMIAPETLERLEQDESGIFMREVLYPKAHIIEPELINWDNYLHTPGARCREQVWWKAYVQFYDKDSFQDRFKNISDELREMIGFQYAQQGIDDHDGTPVDKNEVDNDGYAKVYEIWDIRDYKCYWLSADCATEFLDKDDDIYELKEFMPDEAIIGTTPTNSYYPIPDYTQLGHIVCNMDFLANRIWRITKALKPEGVYDKDQPEIKIMVREAGDADIVPIENYQRFAEKGGIKSVIDWSDKSALAAALIQTYDAFDRQKQLFYEISGYTDTMRGQGSPSESATQTATKDKYVVTRQSEDINKIQECARGLLEKMCDLALKELDDELILQMAQVNFIAEDDREYIPQAMQMLRNDKLRTFQIDIETDSTVAVNSDIEKAARFELLDTVSNLVDRVSAVRNTVPELMPMVNNAAQYAVRGMRQSAAIEESIEQSFEAIISADEEMATNPPPNPEMMKLEMEKAKADRQMMIEEQKLQIELMAQQNKAKELALKEEELRVEVESKLLEADVKRDTASLKAQTDLMKVNASNNPF